MNRIFSVQGGCYYRGGGVGCHSTRSTFTHDKLLLDIDFSVLNIFHRLKNGGGGGGSYGPPETHLTTKVSTDKHAKCSFVQMKVNQNKICGI